MVITRSPSATQVLLIVLHLVGLALSQASTTGSAISAAPSGSTNCTDTVPGTNVSACFFTTANAPPCARPCLQQVAFTVPCATTDLRCLCAHSTDLESGVLPCLQANCSINDVTTTVNYYFSVCNDAHLPLQGAASSTSASLAPTNTATATATAAASPVQSTGLSSGAQAGIGVGCAAVGLSILSVGLFLLRRRSKRKQIPPTTPIEPSTRGSYKLKPPPAFSLIAQGVPEIGEKSLPPTPRRLSIINERKPSTVKDKSKLSAVEIADSVSRASLSPWAIARPPVGFGNEPAVEIDGMETKRSPRQ